MKWKVISASVRGSAHQRSGLPNQDAVDYVLSSREDGSPTVLAVADGHGSSRYFRSQVGSTLAVHTAVRLTKEFLAQPQRPDPAAQLCPQIVQAWLAAVASDLNNNPFSEEELAALEAAEGPASRQMLVERPELAYGATLLVAAALGELMLYLQLGDGDILAVGAGGVTTRPMAVDERLVANQTTSLCQPEAWREFRVATVEGADQLPLMVLLSSDGYMNSFRSEEDFMQIGQDYLNLLRETGSEPLTDDLPRILQEATQQGSGDDITLGILHREVLPRSTQQAMETARKVLPPASKPAATSVAAVPVVSKSAIIRDLKSEQSTQQQKLNELENHYEGARKHIRQLWLLVVLVLFAAAAFATQSLWMPLISGKQPRPSQGGGQRRAAPRSMQPAGSVPGTQAQDPPLPPIQTDPSGVPPRIAPIPIEGETAAAAPAKQWVLTLSDGRQILLEAGRALSAADVGPGPAEAHYAKVKTQDNTLKLTNLSGDLWTVTLPGTPGKAQYRVNESVNLQDGIRIDFHKSSSGVVTARHR